MRQSPLLIFSLSRFLKLALARAQIFQEHIICYIFSDRLSGVDVGAEMDSGIDTAQGNFVCQSRKARIIANDVWRAAEIYLECNVVAPEIKRHHCCQRRTCRRSV